MTLDTFRVPLSLQMCRLSMLLLLTSSYFVATASSATFSSYSFIHLQSCPDLCKIQYSYDFTGAIHLALDNLEDNATYSHASGEANQIMMGLEPDSVVPIIKEIPVQCHSHNEDESVGEAIENSSTPIMAVLSGECQLVTFNQSILNDLIQISYSPNIGETYSSGQLSFSSNSTIHMFPSQMRPTTVLALLEFYGWRKAIILTERNTQLEEISSAVDSFIVSVVPLDTDGPNEPKDVLEHVLEGDYHVIVLNTYPQAARRILCEGYHLKEMHYPQYVWILPGWFEDSWWKEEKDDDIKNFDRRTCTLEELKAMLSNTIGIIETPSNYLEEQNEFNSSFRTFKSQYVSAVGHENEENTTKQIAPPELAAYAYDSVLLLAAALSIQNVSINYKLSADTMMDYLSAKGYLGTTGQISFDEVGWRVSIQAYVTLYREDSNQLLKRVAIGIIDNTNGDRPQFMYINNESASTVWSGDEHPPVRIEINGIILPLTVTYYTLAAVGILFGGFCIGFNIRYRKYKVIRLSSPNLNYITCAGGIILLLSAFFIGSPSKTTSLFPFLCMGNVWAGAIGASLQYGTIQAKMFRVYIIFRRPGQKNIVLKDWHLAIYVAILVAIDVVLLSVVTAIPEAQSIGKLVIDHEHPPIKDATGVTLVSLIHDCESQKKGVDTYWFVVLFGYKLVLQIIVTVLAFLVCSTKVEIEALNDHRAVQAITYINMTILIVSVALAFAVSNYANAKAAVNGLSVLVGAYFNLSLVFLPKMYALYKDPDGTKIFKSTTSIVGGTPEQSTTSSNPSGHAVAKEEISVTSNLGGSQLIAVQHSVGLNDNMVTVATANGTNQVQGTTTEPLYPKPHPLTVTSAFECCTSESQQCKAQLETTMDHVIQYASS